MKKNRANTLATAGAMALAAGLLYWCAPACSPKTESPDEDADDTHQEENAERKAIRLDENELKEFGIELATASAGKLRIEVTLPGEVAPNANQVAHIVPRFQGIVKEVRKEIGERVTNGEVLAVIESNESLTPYEVKSLMDGTVIERHIAIGELIKEDIDAFVIADLSLLWVNLRIYQKDLPYVRRGQSVHIRAGHGIPDARGKIFYVAPMVDEKTRTGLARVALPNPDGLWRPGLFVTGRVTVSEVEVPLLVPKTALQTIEEKTCVFVQTQEGFEPRPVTPGRANETHSEIVSGLETGERYVGQGAFTLKAELSKGELGDEHGH